MVRRSVAADGPARPGHPGRARPGTRHADGGFAARRRRASPEFRRALASVPGRGEPGAARRAAAPPGRRRAASGQRASTTLPDGPLLLVANEFLDALPIRQLVRGRAHWAERMVALDDSGRLVFADGPRKPGADAAGAAGAARSPRRHRSSKSARPPRRSPPRSASGSPGSPARRCSSITAISRASPGRHLAAMQRASRRRAFWNEPGAADLTRACRFRRLRRGRAGRRRSGPRPGAARPIS